MSLSTIGAGPSNLALFSQATGGATATRDNAVIAAKVPERGPSTTGLSGSVQTGTPNRMDMSTARMFQVSQSSSDAPFSSPLNMNRAPAFLNISQRTDGSNASALERAGFTNLGKPPSDLPNSESSLLREFASLSAEDQA
ncbi:MAG: hypothetical protein LBT98_03915, partial [Puniceicoccales bacterium]|nr:hypothetical protein [Puniceicoccales bacterium]